MTEEKKTIYWSIPGQEFFGATEVTLDSEKLARMYKISDWADNLTTDDAPWYSEEYVRSRMKCDSNDSEYIAELAPAIAEELIGRVVFAEHEVETLNKVLDEIRHILSPAWEKGRVFPAYLGAVETARVKAIEELL